MSKDMMQTDTGGEQTQYEAATHYSNTPHDKSGGQLGSSGEQTKEDPNKTEERQQGQHKVAETRQQQAEVEKDVHGLPKG